MNFQHMPELQYQNYIVIGAMVLIGIIMVFFSEREDGFK
jgi:Mg2+ and Co2+ transporter CorA